ncbi:MULTISPECIES: hypothetical protein [unclassified Paraflavitalea]|jgi:hypothetical protein|uniref:hypothetical protein n=1 Tax=unclassified Paraflavitalea TaxID=2798305 RepID=UPI003D324ECA
MEQPENRSEDERRRGNEEIQRRNRKKNRGEYRSGDTRIGKPLRIRCDRCAAAVKEKYNLRGSSAF